MKDVSVSKVKYADTPTLLNTVQCKKSVLAALQWISKESGLSKY